LNELPADIAVSLKNTPHDFYPTFPDNPLIGRVGAREQWIEYDVHGQYFGWGVAPSIMIDDLLHRLGHGLESGVSGFILRTDWEGIQDHSCFDTVNLINLYAAAMLGRKAGLAKREIYSRWLVEEKLVDDPISPASLQSCVEWAERLLERTWPLVRSILYVNGTVFSDSSAFHVSLDQSAWIAESLHSLKDWSANAQDALAMRDENVRRILDEKDESVRQADALHREAASANPGLKREAYSKLVRGFDFIRWYAEGFRLTTRVCILSRLEEEPGRWFLASESRPLGELLQSTLDDLRAYRERLQQSPFVDIYPACVLLDAQRLESFLRTRRKGRPIARAEAVSGSPRAESRSAAETGARSIPDRRTRLLPPLPSPTAADCAAASSPSQGGSPCDTPPG
jgi:hypothetical protein